MNKGTRTGLTYSQLFRMLFKQIKPNYFTQVIVLDIYDLCDEVGKRSKIA